MIFLISSIPVAFKQLINNDFSNQFKFSSISSLK